MARMRGTNSQRTRRPQPDVPPSPPAASHWKDHPVVIATVVASATVGLAVVLVKEIILPTQTATLTNEVTSLKSQVSSQSKQLTDLQKEKSKELTDLHKERDDAEEKILSLKERVLTSETANLFALGNPYPVGLGKVRVGDPIARVSNVYPKEDIEKHEDFRYWSVKGQHTIFTDIVYYFDETLQDRPITHILFTMESGEVIDENFLQSKLVEALGAPKLWKNDKFYSWNTPFKLTVYKNEKDSFILMGDGRRLAYWPYR